MEGYCSVAEIIPKAKLATVFLERHILVTKPAFVDILQKSFGNFFVKFSLISELTVSHLRLLFFLELLRIAPLYICL